MTGNSKHHGRRSLRSNHCKTMLKTVESVTLCEITVPLAGSAQDVGNQKIYDDKSQVSNIVQLL